MERIKQERAQMIRSMRETIKDRSSSDLERDLRSTDFDTELSEERIKELRANLSSTQAQREKLLLLAAVIRQELESR